MTKTNSPKGSADKGQQAIPAGTSPQERIGAGQIGRFTAGELFVIVAVIFAVAIILLFIADSWVWSHVSPDSAFAAIAAESNVALAAGAFFAIWSSGQDSQNTREILRQMQQQYIEMHERGESGDQSDRPQEAQGSPPRS